jgi:anti-sigma factor RsiW
MSAKLCGMLEGYLEGSLAGPAKAEFERHLPSCPACREEIEEERRLDALLARAAERLESPPAALRGALAASIRIERRRRALLMAWAAVAAAILIVCGLRFGGAGPAGAPESPVHPVAVAPPAARPPVRVDFGPDAPVIGMMVESASPDVSIVFIYPTLGSQENGGPR